MYNLGAQRVECEWGTNRAQKVGHWWEHEEEPSSSVSVQGLPKKWVLWSESVSNVRLHDMISVADNFHFSFILAGTLHKVKHKGSQTAAHGSNTSIFFF